MQADLTAFPGEDAAGLAALESRADLDRYTYYAAGCVGEFWTEMAMAHRPGCARWNPDVMRTRGVRFGQALQMTNVLRDVAQDLRIGRCYLPRHALAARGLAPADLLDPASMPRLPRARRPGGLGETASRGLKITAPSPVGVGWLACAWRC
jgi:farnesyl-diphosphate farnesyltransferase